MSTGSTMIGQTTVRLQSLAKPPSLYSLQYDVSGSRFSTQQVHLLMSPHDLHM